MPYGIAGLAVSLIGCGVRPDQPLIVAGASLIIGGLAGFARADWRSLSLGFLRGGLNGALSALDKGRRHERGKSSDAAEDSDGG